MGERVYIAGPMAGKPDLNGPMFMSAARVIVVREGTPVNPHYIEPRSHVGPCPPGAPAAEPGDHAAPCHLKADILELLTCDSAVFLPGWEASAGARLEMTVATQCGIPVLFFDAENLEIIALVDGAPHRVVTFGPELAVTRDV